jgi:hypothetical protein
LPDSNGKKSQSQKKKSGYLSSKRYLSPARAKLAVPPGGDVLTFVAVCIAVAVDEEIAVPGVADTTVTPFTYSGAETTVADGSIPEVLCIALSDCAANSDPAHPTARMAITSIIYRLFIACFIRNLKNIPHP